MHPEEFLQQQKERNKKKKRRALIICIVVCAMWIPIALFLYQPTLLFEKEPQETQEPQQEPQGTQQDALPDG